MTAGDDRQRSTVPPLRVPPALTATNRAFWTEGASGVLAIARCSACGNWDHPPRARCRACHSADVHPEPASGRGTVATFTVNRQQWNPAGVVDPYVIALVELVEQAGLRLLTNVVDCDPTDVTIGAPVHVTFEPLDDVWLPVFRLDGR